jgi:hypothetical protein
MTTPAMMPAFFGVDVTPEPVLFGGLAFAHVMKLAPPCSVYEFSGISAFK